MHQRNANKAIADDSKWGCVICFGMIITFIAGIGHINSFGLIYNDFIIETNSSSRSFTTAHGVFAIMLAIGGITLNIVRKKLSLRVGGLIGAIIFSTGSFTTILISNISQLSITFGVLQGIGLGMMVPVCYSTFNIYFTKKRTMAMSATKAVQGIILMGYPYLLKQIVMSYGFKGTLLILSGISLHPIAGMLVMITRKNEQKVTNAKTAKSIFTAPGVVKDINETGLFLKDNDEVAVENANSNVTADDKNNDKKHQIRFYILEIFNLKVLRDPIYCNICIGQSFVNFSDLSFFILQPMLLFQYGYDPGEIATCISLCAGADVLGRISLAVFSAVVPVNTRKLFYFATTATFVGRLVMLQLDKFIWVAFVTALLGFLRAWLHVASPLVIANQVSHEDFPGAYALSTLAAGIVNVVCSPLIGALKDAYQDYQPAFYVLALCCLPCLLLWPLEYVYATKNNDKPEF